jgi:hypothetical protein
VTRHRKPKPNTQSNYGIFLIHYRYGIDPVTVTKHSFKTDELYIAVLQFRGILGDQDPRLWHHRAYGSSVSGSLVYSIVGIQCTVIVLAGAQSGLCTGLYMVPELIIAVSASMTSMASIIS